MTTKQPKIKTWVLMFERQFHDLVKRGLKCQTIRPVRKRAPAIGDRVSLRAWKGSPYRSKQRVLAVGTVTEVVEFQIDLDGTMSVDGLPLCGTEPNDLARNDGFKDRAAMLAWFVERYELAFRGTLIRWKLA